MNLVPINLSDARKFIQEHHRHNTPPQGARLSVGLEHDGKLVGVATAGRPVARMLDDGFTLEVTRSCTLGDKNANSILYGAIGRAAKAIGYHRLITYTLASEPGTSLKASGFTCEAELPERPTWSRPSRPRYQTNLFGEVQRPPEAKKRWSRVL